MFEPPPTVAFKLVWPSPIDWFFFFLGIYLMPPAFAEFAWALFADPPMLYTLVEFKTVIC